MKMMWKSQRTQGHLHRKLQLKPVSKKHLNTVKVKKWVLLDTVTFHLTGTVQVSLNHGKGSKHVLLLMHLKNIQKSMQVLQGKVFFPINKKPTTCQKETFNVWVVWQNLLVWYLQRTIHLDAVITGIKKGCKPHYLYIVLYAFIFERWENIFKLSLYIYCICK